MTFFEFFFGNPSERFGMDWGHHLVTHGGCTQGHACHGSWTSHCVQGVCWDLKRVTNICEFYGWPGESYQARDPRISVLHCGRVLLCITAKVTARARLCGGKTPSAGPRHPFATLLEGRALGLQRRGEYNCSILQSEGPVFLCLMACVLQRCGVFGLGIPAPPTKWYPNGLRVSANCVLDSGAKHHRPSWDGSGPPVDASRTFHSFVEVS